MHENPNKLKLDMKELLLLLVAFSLSFPAVSQFGLSVGSFRPTGDFGFVAEPGLSLKASAQSSFDQNRLYFSLAHAFVSPRAELFSSPGFLYSDDEVTVVEAGISYNKMSFTNFAVGFDLAPFELNSFAPYAGVGIAAGFWNVSYETYKGGVSDGSFSGGYTSVGLQLRLGVDYAISDSFSVMINTERVYYISKQIDPINNNLFEIGIRYDY